MELSHSTIWFICGAALVALEAILFPGVGVLFAGLGAVTVGVALVLGLIDSLVAQFVVFFVSTGIWAIMLWKIIKNALRGKKSGFDDMVGSAAVVFGNALENGKMGQVKWSGAIMNCRLESGIEEMEKIEPGTEVTIASISKGLLIVRPKRPDYIDNL